MGKTYLAKRRRSLSVSGPGDSQVPPIRSRSDARATIAQAPAPICIVTPNHSDLQCACQVCGPPSSDPRATQPVPRVGLQLRSAIRVPRDPQLRSARHPSSPANPRNPGFDPRATQPARRVPFFQVWLLLHGPWLMGFPSRTPLKVLTKSPPILGPDATIAHRPDPLHIFTPLLPAHQTPPRLSFEPSPSWPLAFRSIMHSLNPLIAHKLNNLCCIYKLRC